MKSPRATCAWLTAIGVAALLVTSAGASHADLKRSVVFLVDASKGMEQNAWLEAAREAALLQMQALSRANANSDEPQCEWAVMYFNKSDVWLQSPFTTGDMQTAPQQLFPDGGRPLVWGITQALRYLYHKGKGEVGTIVTVSSGVDECETRSPQGGFDAISKLNGLLANVPLAEGRGAEAPPQGDAEDTEDDDSASELPRKLGEDGETVEDGLEDAGKAAENSNIKAGVNVVGLGVPPGSPEEAALRSISTAGRGTYVDCPDTTQVKTALERATTEQPQTAGTDGGGTRQPASTPTVAEDGHINRIPGTYDGKYKYAEPGTKYTVVLEGDPKKVTWSVTVTRADGTSRRAGGTLLPTGGRRGAVELSGQYDRPQGDTRGWAKLWVQWEKVTRGDWVPTVLRLYPEKPTDLNSSHTQIRLKRQE